MSSNLHSKPARVNIVLQHERQEAQQKKELPFRLLVLADFLQQSSSIPLAKRARISVNAGGLTALMQHLQPQLHLNIDSCKKPLAVHLRFQSLNDFKPQALIENIPALKKLAQTCGLLQELRTAMLNDKALKQKLNHALSSKQAKRQCLQQLGEVNNGS